MVEKERKSERKKKLDQNMKRGMERPLLEFWLHSCGGARITLDKQVVLLLHKH